MLGTLIAVAAIVFLQSSDALDLGLRIELHVALRTDARRIGDDLRMHRAYVDGLRRSEDGEHDVLEAVHALKTQAGPIHYSVTQVARLR